jgi:hypothetical protein
MFIHYISLVLLNVVHVLSLSDVAFVLWKLLFGIFVLSSASLPFHHERLVWLRNDVCACVTQRVPRFRSVLVVGGGRLLTLIVVLHIYMLVTVV